MKKVVCFCLMLVGLAGCAMEPMTPEQRAAIDSYNQQYGYGSPYQQSQQPRSLNLPQTCLTNQLSADMYSVNCR